LTGDTSYGIINHLPVPYKGAVFSVYLIIFGVKIQDTMSKTIQQLNIGLLGGGQLGRMLIQNAINLNLNISVLRTS